MSCENTSELMDLLVKNPTSLCNEDLEKLCDAITKGAIDNRAISQSCYRAAEMHGEGDTVVINPSKDSIAASEKTQTFGAQNYSIVSQQKTKQVMFHHPVAQTTQCIHQGTILASGDGSQPFQYISSSAERLTPSNELKRQSDFVTMMLPNSNGAGNLRRPAHADNCSVEETASRRLFAAARLKQSENAPAQIIRTADDEEVKFATVKGTACGDGAPQFRLLVPGTSNAVALTCPFNTGYQVVPARGNSYGARGTQLKYTVPCSHQAIATTTWLMDHFEENTLSTLPRSVMYEEYVRYFEQETNIKCFNQAVFGKMVRACFPNLTTRRLGIRGHSRYHYAGLGVKPTSAYANCTFVRSAPNYPRARPVQKKPLGVQLGVAANVTIDGSENDQTAVSEEIGSGDGNNATKRTTLDDFLSTYPGIDQLIPTNGIDQGSLCAFVNFYTDFNKQLLSFMTSLDQEKTKDHLQSFSILFPDECVHILSLLFVQDIVRLYDGILFKKATECLLPDCLATLPAAFKVSVRQYAKSLVEWISETDDAYCSSKEIHRIRLAAASQWAEYVKRVTTLCHVAKEARKSLRDLGVTKQLRLDLEGVDFDEISSACAWCGDGDGVQSTHSSDRRMREMAAVKTYLSKFLKMLKNRAALEDYIRVLNEIAEEHIFGGAGFTVKLQDMASLEQQFLMKWAMYTSKFLAEFTLKTSGSVGTFHLISLLFGDYITHRLCVRREKAARAMVARRTLRIDQLLK